MTPFRGFDSPPDLAEFVRQHSDWRRMPPEQWARYAVEQQETMRPCSLVIAVERTEWEHLHAEWQARRRRPVSPEQEFLDTVAPKPSATPFEACTTCGAEAHFGYDWFGSARNIAWPNGRLMRGGDRGIDHQTYIRARDAVWSICHELQCDWRADCRLTSWTGTPERGPLLRDSTEDQTLELARKDAPRVHRGRGRRAEHSRNCGRSRAGA
jgi:hypothetical protein